MYIEEKEVVDSGDRRNGLLAFKDVQRPMAGLPLYFIGRCWSNLYGEYVFKVDLQNPTTPMYCSVTMLVRYLLSIVP